MEATLIKGFNLNTVAKRLKKYGKDRDNALVLIKGKNKDYEFLKKVDQNLYFKVLCAIKDNEKRDNQDEVKLKYEQRKGGFRFKYDKDITFNEHLRDYFNLTYWDYKWITKDGCKLCKSKKRTHLHHKIPISKGGNNNKNNLVPLCNDCHLRIHNKKEW